MNLQEHRPNKASPSVVEGHCRDLTPSDTLLRALFVAVIGLGGLGPIAFYFAGRCDHTVAFSGMALSVLVVLCLMQTLHVRRFSTMWLAGSVPALLCIASMPIELSGLLTLLRLAVCGAGILVVRAVEERGWRYAR